MYYVWLSRHPVLGSGAGPRMLCRACLPPPPHPLVGLYQQLMDRYIINVSTSTPLTNWALNFIWNLDNSIIPDDNNHCENNLCPVQLMSQEINNYVNNWTLPQEDRDAVYAAFEVRRGPGI